MDTKKQFTPENAGSSNEETQNKMHSLRKKIWIGILIVPVFMIAVVVIFLIVNFGVSPFTVAVIVIAGLLLFGRIGLSVLKRFLGAKVVRPAAQKVSKAIDDSPVWNIAPENAVFSDEEIQQKMRTYKKWNWIGKLTVPVFVVIIFGLFARNVNFSSSSFTEFVLTVFGLPAVAVVVMIGVLVFVHKRKSAYKDLMGSAVTLPVIREIFEVEKYQPLGHIQRDTVSAAGLIYGWDRIEGSDYIEGRYKGVNIVYSDLFLYHIEKETDSDGKKSSKRVTDFRGQWIICDFGKELAATLRLIERKGGTNWNRTHDISKSSIETENDAFNKKFRIVTDDEHTAFYLLTPHFMEQLVAADEAADSSTLFCFMDGKVHIALYSGRDSRQLHGLS